jgi:Family of unknown function (DUF6496)
VKSRKQAIAIALSKARKKGKKVPRKKPTTAFSLFAGAFLPALAAHYAPRASVTRVRACPSLSEMGQPAWAIPTEAFTPCQLRGLLSLRRA